MKLGDSSKSSERSHVELGSDDDESNIGPWAAKGNPPEYLDSEDGGRSRARGGDYDGGRTKRDRLIGQEWRELGEFFIFQIVLFWRWITWRQKII